MPDFAHERAANGLAMPGLFVLPTAMSIGTAIEEWGLILRASEADEWFDRVVYLPTR